MSNLTIIDGSKSRQQQTTECAGCGGDIWIGDKVWISDVGEEKNIITHPLAECLAKFIQPEETVITGIGEAR